MADNYDFNLRGYTTDQLYDYLKNVILSAKIEFKLKDDSSYKFRDGNREGNILSVRGFYKHSLSPVKNNKNNLWDDALFVIRKDKDGNKEVHSFRVSTEHKPGLEMSLMMPGMYKYKLHFHKWPQMEVYTDPAPADGGLRPTAIEPKPEYDMNAAAYDNPEEIQFSPDTGHESTSEHRKTYRALSLALRERAGHPSHDNQIVDIDGDLERDRNESDSFSPSLNIHYGGAGVEGPGGYSEGCQVIGTWSEYKKFVRLIEEDTKILGSINNRLAPVPATDGTEYVIYTLVEGSFLKPLSISSPFYDYELNKLYKLHEKVKTGFFPIGKNHFWHGGVHFDIDASAKVRCIADGELIAYRVNRKPVKVSLTQKNKKTKEYQMSTGFALVKHAIETPNKSVIKFYSLYMHLLDYETLKNREYGPFFITEWKYRVDTDVHGKGLNIRSKTDFNKVVAVVPKGALLKVDKKSKPAKGWAKKDWAKNKSLTWYEMEFEGKVGYAVYKSKSRKIKDLAGDQYQCLTSEDTPDGTNGVLGLNIYKAKDEKAIVLKIIKQHDIIKFVRPEEVGYDGIIKKGWFEVEGGGWVRIKDRDHLKGEFEYTKPELDKVINVSKKMPAGAILGYPGPYFDSSACIHFEILLPNIDFMKNSAGDLGGAITLAIPRSSSFKQRIEKLDKKEVQVDLPPKSVLEVDTEESWGGYTKVSCKSVVGWSKEIGYSAAKKFFAKDDITEIYLDLPKNGEPDPEKFSIAIKKDTKVQKLAYKGQYIYFRYVLTGDQKKNRTGWVEDKVVKASEDTHILTDALGKMFSQHPVSYDFSNEAGKNDKVMLYDFQESETNTCIDSKNKKWYEIQLKKSGEKGWLEVSPGMVQTIYDWPHWLRFEEKAAKDISKKNDGFCDRKELEKMIEDYFGNVDTNIKKSVSEKIRKVVCVHPTEWTTAGNKYERLKNAPWGLDDTRYSETTQYIDKLQWWDDVPQSVRDDFNNDPTKIWSPHPIGFLIHLQEIIKVSKDVS